VKSFLDASYRYLSAQYLRKQSRQLKAQLQCVGQSNDPECVHRARVASRRLRAALRFFEDCFPPKVVKDWRKELRRVTRELGEARDTDVQIQSLVAMLAGGMDAACVPGVVRVLARLETQRESKQKEVQSVGERFLHRGTGRRISVAAGKMLAKVPEGTTSSSESVFREARERIQSRLKEFLDWESCLADPEASERHHQMRIAGKQLRYTMEMCRAAYGSGLHEYLAAVKDIQQILGDIHDCDVWSGQLSAMIEDERQRMTTAFGHAMSLERLMPGLDFLRDRWRSRRVEQFARLREYWEELRSRRVWERLVESLDAAARPSAASEASPQPDEPAKEASRSRRHCRSRAKKPQELGGTDGKAAEQVV
jgi:CHAD domain-containing protein